MAIILRTGKFNQTDCSIVLNRTHLVTFYLEVTSFGRNNQCHNSELVSLLLQMSYLLFDKLSALFTEVWLSIDPVSCRDIEHPHTRERIARQARVEGKGTLFPYLRRAFVPHKLAPKYFAAEREGGIFHDI